MGMNTLFVHSSDLLSNFTAGDCRQELYFSADKKAVYKQRWNGTVRPANTLRVSEAYLNRAEAYAQKSDGMASALADLNKLRGYRIVGYTDVNISGQAALLDEIRLERRLEFCFEEHRWFDLRRYGMPSISHRYKDRSTDAWTVYVLKEKDPLYTFPIPNSMLEKNIMLEQNACAYEPVRTGITGNM